MDIVIGRGNKRQVVGLPCARIIKGMTKYDQRNGRVALCRLLGVSEVMPVTGTTGKRSR